MPIMELTPNEKYVDTKYGTILTVESVAETVTFSYRVDNERNHTLEEARERIENKRYVPLDSWESKNE